jgi:hypothetical protein
MSYEIKGKPTKITATSRSAIKVHDNFYTIEASEERSVSDDIDMESEFDALFNELNDVVDKQVKNIVDTFK